MSLVLSGRTPTCQEKLLRRVLRFSGPALLPEDPSIQSFPFKPSGAQAAYLDAYAEDQVKRLTSKHLKADSVLSFLDPRRPLSIPVVFSKVPIFTTSTSSPAQQSAELPKVAHGYGDLASIPRLSNIFSEDETARLLASPDKAFLLFENLRERLVSCPQSWPSSVEEF